MADSLKQRGGWVGIDIIDYADGDRNILLDCDVEVLFPLNKVLGLLDNYDVAARNLPFETKKKFKLENGDEIADLSLSEINTGVILFRKSEGARQLFSSWHDNFLKMGEARDQPAFLKALIETPSSRFFALPPMWNATPFASVDLAQMNRRPRSIRILHYRDPTFWPAVAKRLADIHERAVIDLYEESSEFDQQRDAYRRTSRQYRNPLFRLAAGRALLRAGLILSTRDRKARLRVVGEKRVPTALP